MCGKMTSAFCDPIVYKLGMIFYVCCMLFNGICISTWTILLNLHLIRIQYFAYVSSAVNHSIINICMLGHDLRELWEGCGCIIFRLEWLMAEDITSRNTRNCVASPPFLCADDICVLGCPKFAIEENPKRLIHYGGQSKLMC